MKLFSHYPTLLNSRLGLVRAYLLLEGIRIAEEYSERTGIDWKPDDLILTKYIRERTRDALALMKRQYPNERISPNENNGSLPNGSLPNYKANGKKIR